MRRGRVAVSSGFEMKQGLPAQAIFLKSDELERWSCGAGRYNLAIRFLFRRVGVPLIQATFDSCFSCPFSAPRRHGRGSRRSNGHTFIGQFETRAGPWDRYSSTGGASGHHGPACQQGWWRNKAIAGSATRILFSKCPDVVLGTTGIATTFPAGFAYFFPVIPRVPWASYSVSQRGRRSD